MTVVKIILVGVCLALGVGLVVLFWQYVLAGIVVLLFVLWVLNEAKKPPIVLSPEEQERRIRSFVNYQISQDLAERREAAREAQAQWWQQQQPPPRGPSTWGGGDGGRYC